VPPAAEVVDQEKEIALEPTPVEQELVDLEDGEL
jgi:hypothetical protein